MALGQPEEAGPLSYSPYTVVRSSSQAWSGCILHSILRQSTSPYKLHLMVNTYVVMAAHDEAMGRLAGTPLLNFGHFSERQGRTGLESCTI